MINYVRFWFYSAERVPITDKGRVPARNHEILTLRSFCDSLSFFCDNFIKSSSRY